MKTIITPVDFSGSTAHVLAAARELATSLEARIILLHVVQPPIVTSDYGLAMENVREILAVSEKAATRQLSHIVEQLKAKGVSVRTIQVNGAPVKNIIECAEKNRADYIVMGSHGHTSLYDLLVGSTTHGVLKKAKCPVLIVPAKPKKKTPSRKR